MDYVKFKIKGITIEMPIDAIAAIAAIGTLTIGVMIL